MSCINTDKENIQVGNDITQLVNNHTNSALNATPEANKLAAKRNEKLSIKILEISEKIESYDFGGSLLVPMLHELSLGGNLTSDFVDNYIRYWIDSPDYIEKGTLFSFKSLWTTIQSTFKESSKYTHFLCPLIDSTAKHWSLVVVEKNSNTVLHFDSLNLESSETLLHNRIRHIVSEAVKHKKYPIQNTTYDGGVYTLCMYHQLCITLQSTDKINPETHTSFTFSREFLRSQISKKLNEKYLANLFRQVQERQVFEAKTEDRGIQTEPISLCESFQGNKGDSETALKKWVEINETKEISEHHSEPINEDEDIEVEEQFEQHQQNVQVDQENEKEQEVIPDRELDQLLEEDIEVDQENQNKVNSESPQHKKWDDESEDEWLWAKPITKAPTSSETPKLAPAPRLSSPPPATLLGWVSTTKSPYPKQSVSPFKVQTRSSDNKRRNKYKGRKCFTRQKGFTEEE